MDVMDFDQQQFVSSEELLGWEYPRVVLFVVYINDLPVVFGEVSPIESYFYANDSNLMVKSRNIENVVQTTRDALEKTGDLRNDNNLVLNMGRTECLIFSTSRSNLLVFQSVHIDLNMNELTQMILGSLDSGEIPLCLFLDLSKNRTEILGLRDKKFQLIKTTLKIDRWMSWTLINNSLCQVRNCWDGSTPGVHIDLNMNELTQMILGSLDSGEIPLCLFLDLSKNRTEILGLRDKKLQLIKTTLKIDRWMSWTLINNSLCQVRELLEWEYPRVVLFVVYINDLPVVFGEVSPIESYFYADDSNLMMKSRNIGNVVQTTRDALEKTGDLRNDNNLVLNMGRTECLVFSTSRSNLLISQSISFNNILI
ncbi:hypothetical protein HHI36_006626 [Cryptolaemus montrouzieri]|uniref:Uncharacterized protein n=1 Tax=Cryptolaemus montrouzieri TaxID=559131 RepID=A0ABD2NXN3_9CUCU